MYSFYGGCVQSLCEQCVVCRMQGAHCTVHPDVSLLHKTIQLHLLRSLTILFFFSFSFHALALPKKVVHVSVVGSSGQSSRLRSLRALLQSRGFILSPDVRSDKIIYVQLHASGRLVLRRDTFQKKYSIPLGVRNPDVFARAVLLYVDIFWGDYARHTTTVSAKKKKYVASTHRTTTSFKTRRRSPSVQTHRALHSKSSTFSSKGVNQVHTKRRTQNTLRKRKFKQHRVRRTKRSAANRHQVGRQVSVVRTKKRKNVQKRQTLRRSRRRKKTKRTQTLSRSKSVLRKKPNIQASSRKQASLVRARSSVKIRSVPRRVLRVKVRSRRSKPSLRRSIQKKKRLALRIRRRQPPPVVQIPSTWGLGGEVLGLWSPLGLDGVPLGGGGNLIGFWRQWTLRLGAVLSGVLPYDDTQLLLLRTHILVGWEPIRWSSFRLGLEIGGHAEFFWFTYQKRSATRWRWGVESSLRATWQWHRHWSVFFVVSGLFSPQQMVFLGPLQTPVYSTHYVQMNLVLGVQFRL